MLAWLASVWQAITAGRAALYDRRWFPVRRLPRPAVAVGALTVGGSGKTPATELLAGTLLDAGLRPAVLSRGYRRRSRGPLLVSTGDGTGPRVPHEVSGDEPAWLARALPRAPVAVASRRERGARLVLEAADVDVFVLDDAFQHLRVGREADCLMVDASAPFWQDRPLPAGRLREAPAAAGRADAFLLLGDPEELLPELERRHPGKPSFLLRPTPPAAWRLEIYRPDLPAASRSAVDLPGPLPQDAALARPSTLPGPLWAFAGIARPERFFADLEAAGLELAGRRAFPDHHGYRARDLEEIDTAATASGAAGIVTTEKDAARLRAAPGAASDLPCWVWRYRLEAVEPDALSAWLRGRLDGDGP